MPEDILIRRAEEKDMILYFHWANDEAVRRHSIQKKPITLDEHRVWFLKKVADPQVFLYLFEKDGIPVGQTRIEVNGEIGILSYSLDRSFRGKGLGAIVVRLGLEAISREKPAGLHVIKGWVQATNHASIRIFEKLGFRLIDQDVINGESYLVFERPLFITDHQ